MQIGDFNIRYNELHPDVCYAYELFDDAKTEKYSMFTMDIGKIVLKIFVDGMNTNLDIITGVILMKLNAN